MSKAILIIDMPSRCNECHLLDEPYDLCVPMNKDVSDYQSETRPEWCPLREMPQKKEEIVYTSLSGIGEKKGWNACIDAILKEGTKYELE